MMIINTARLRPAERHELDQIADWAFLEGWNPGLHDAEVCHGLDPKAFLVIPGSDGGPLGSISAVRYGTDFGFIGYFMVLPELRGGRIGLELGRGALDLLEGRNIGIDGVENKVANYRTWGFEPACCNIRHQGETRPGKSAPKAFISLTGGDAEMVADLDARFFPARRELFWFLWLSRHGTRAYGMMNETNEAALDGMVVARPCRRGYKIGPLYARHPEQAGGLLQQVLMDLPPETPYFLDVPDFNSEALQLAGEFGMTPVFRTVRMYNREIPKLDRNEVYGITSFELG